MRVAAIVLLALVWLAVPNSGGLAAAPPGVASPAADPLCVPTCTVTGYTMGYLQPVTVVTSGATVVWETLDVGHTNVDGLLPAFDYCMMETVWPGDPAPSTTFVIDAEGLRADGVLCASAQATPAGFMLGFWCLQHPQMRGAVAVVPDI